MPIKGSEYYDNDDFFKNYSMKRATKDNPNDTIEKPIFLDLIGDVMGLKILDLGCGDAKFGIEMIEKGCKEYVGVEGSINMCKLAQQNLKNSIPGIVIHCSIEDFSFPKNHFDIVISRLVVHYLEDIETIFHKIHNSLLEGGRFIFSIEHPVITSTLQKQGQRTNWIVDNYFDQGFRQQEWLGATVYKYHRTIEDYYDTLQKSGFVIEALKESCPRKENFESLETYKRRIRIPLFLFLSGRK